MSQNESRFNQVLTEAIDDALVKLFGDQTSKAVKFYLDPNIALKDAGIYEGSIQRMFLDGARVLLDTIIENLYQKTKIQKIESKSLGEIVSFLKSKYNVAGEAVTIQK